MLALLPNKHTADVQSRSYLVGESRSRKSISNSPS